MPRPDGDPDLELLLAQTQVLWGTDSPGPPAAPPLCAVAISAAGHHLLIQPGLDDDLAESLRHVLASWALALPASELRPALTSALPLLEVAGIRGEVHGGPSFLIESLPPVPAGATVADSTAPAGAGTRRPPGWERAEWDALLGGALGPWAVLLSQSDVLSICHTSRESTAGAEAAIWTDPRLSGTADAVAAVSRWATLMRKRDDRPLFYRTSDLDDPEQRIAAGLGLRPIGWIWSLGTSGRAG
jgi:hypothetical protein